MPEFSYAPKNTLHVRKFCVEYLVSCDHPSPEAVKNRFDRIITRNFPNTLAHLIKPFFSKTDPTVWFIRDLKLEVDLNTAWNENQLARSWCSQVAQELNSTIDNCEDNENVIRFADYAEYLASFLLQLSNGIWDKWYYQSFEGLRMLPVTVAIRTALCDQPQIGIQALLRIPEKDLRKIIAILTPQDASRVLISISESSNAGAQNEALFTLWKMWQSTRLFPIVPSNESRNALLIFIQVCRTRPDLSNSELANAAIALLRFAQWTITKSDSERECLLSAISNHDSILIQREIGIADSEILNSLSRFPCEWLKAIQQSPSSISSDIESRNTQQRNTPFGGMFLLLPLLGRLELENAVQGWPDLDDVTAASLLRFLIVVKSFGRANAHRVFLDPVVRDIMGIPSSLDLSTVSRWQVKISKAMMNQLYRHLGLIRQEFWPVSTEKFLPLRIPLSGCHVMIVMDSKFGVWFCASNYRSVDLNEIKTLFPEQFENAETATWELQHKQDRDLRNLLLSRSFKISRTFDLALSVAAQFLLRAFAYRLPGFAESSLPYVFENFLNFSASVEDDETRRIIKCGRPPLNIVLSMTGMTRNTYRVPWLGSRPLMLFPEN